jgi:hypothetical protein
VASRNVIYQCKECGTCVGRNGDLFWHAYGRKIQAILALFDWHEDVDASNPDYKPYRPTSPPAGPPYSDDSEDY